MACAPILFLLGSLYFIVFSATAAAFECFSCNNKAGENDVESCNDERIEVCEPGVTSCSAVFYKTVDRKFHVRKFCTQPGTTVYKHLLFSPGSSLCENIKTTNMKFDDTIFMQQLPVAVDKNGPQPPAPPPSQVSSLLCVCGEEKCNQGDPTTLVNTLMFNNIQHDHAFKKKQTISPIN